MVHREIIRPLLQEIYQPDGWKMLTCCMLLNLTNRKQVLYNRRAKSLKKMSEGYVKGFKSVDELYGIGKYAKDSWEIFQNNNRKVNPTDKVLLAYLSIGEQNEQMG